MSITTKTPPPNRDVVIQADFNNDGKADELTLQQGSCPSGVICEDNFAPTSKLHLGNGKLFELSEPPQFPGTVFGRFTYSLNKSGMRVYADKGLVSVAVGQRVGYTDKQGVFQTMTVKELLMGVDRDRHGKFVQAENRGHKWLAISGTDAQQKKATLGQLVWVTAEGSRLDPNTVHDHLQGELTDPLTAPETLLVKLFEKAPTLKTVQDVTRAVAAWEKTLPKTIAQDKPLLTGIRHALGMLIGLKPADFKD